VHVKSYLRSVRTYLGISGALVVVCAVVLQWVGLANVLGYEYAFASAWVVTCVGLARRIHRARPSTPWRELMRGVADLGGLVGVLALVSLANMVRVKNCDPWVGLGYHVAIAGGAVPMIVLTAMISRRVVSGRWRYVVGYGIVTVSLLSSGLYLALEPSIVTYQSYVGYFAGSIFDESLVGLRRAWILRAWNVTFVVGAVAMISLAARPRLRELVVACVALTVVVIVWANRGDLGLEHRRGYVASVLGGVIETENFIIFYDASSYDDERLRLMVWDHEARYAEFAEFWGVEPRERLRSFVYGSAQQKGDLMGGYRTLVAKIWLGEMHITWGGLGDRMLAHEMAHLFLREDGTGPLRLANYGGVIPIMALVEGAATAAEWGAADLDYHAWSAAMRELGFAEDISSLLGPVGFWSRYSGRAYTLTGSFSRWLIDTYGVESFRMAYGRGAFQQAYGRPLRALIEEWEAFLDEYTLSEEELEVARFRYDRPSLFGRVCARSIATRFEEGEQYLAARDHDAARRCFASILRDDPTNVAYRLRVARAFMRSGLREDAREQASWVGEAEGAGRGYRAMAAELVADIAWLNEEHDEAMRGYASVLTDYAAPSDLRRVRSKIDAITQRAEAPLSERAVRAYLVGDPRISWRQHQAMLVFAGQTEDSSVARYLAGIAAESSASGLTEGMLTDRVVEGLDYDRRVRALEALAVVAAIEGDPAASCERWAEVRREARFGSAHAAYAEMWLGRCRRGDLDALIAVE